MSPSDAEGPAMALELQDGSVCFGRSFGAPKSIAGELVFQTGMVGYPESITDPSYRGQILVLTFPLIGNYGVPPRDTADRLLHDAPAFFESRQIHVAGLVVACYSNDDYSHHLASSSLGTWLREQGVPAITGLDTRALTKRIRNEGSMLGRLLLEADHLSSSAISTGPVNGMKLSNGKPLTNGVSVSLWQSEYQQIPWADPNRQNLVAQGQTAAPCSIPSDHGQCRPALLQSTPPIRPMLSSIPPVGPCAYCVSMSGLRTTSCDAC